MSLGFNRGAELPDPEGLLEGSGKRIRHVKIRSAVRREARAAAATFPRAGGVAVGRRSGRRVVSLGVALALLAGSCVERGGAADGSRVRIADAVSLELPDGLEPVETAATDSAYRRYRSASLWLSVDYGWYADPLAQARGRAWTRRPVEIDGRAAELVTYEDEHGARPYVAALHVPDLGRGAVKLTLLARGRAEADRKRAVRAFRSLRFEASPGSEGDPGPRPGSLP